MENQLENGDKKLGNKFRDLFKGFGIGILYLIIAVFVTISFNFANALPVSFVSLYVILLVLFAFMKKYYILIGLLLSIVLPFMIFGGCMLAMGVH